VSASESASPSLRGVPRHSYGTRGVIRSVETGLEPRVVVQVHVARGVASRFASSQPVGCPGTGSPVETHLEVGEVVQVHVALLVESAAGQPTPLTRRPPTCPGRRRCSRLPRHRHYRTGTHNRRRRRDLPGSLAQASQASPRASPSRWPDPDWQPPGNCRTRPGSVVVSVQRDVLSRRPPGPVVRDVAARRRENAPRDQRAVMHGQGVYRAVHSVPRETNCRLSIARCSSRCRPGGGESTSRDQCAVVWGQGPHSCVHSAARADQALPFHWATRFAATPLALVKLPPRSSRRCTRTGHTHTR